MLPTAKSTIYRTKCETKWAIAIILLTLGAHVQKGYSACFVCLSVCLPACLPACLPVCLFIRYHSSGSVIYLYYVALLFFSLHFQFVDF